MQLNVSSEFYINMKSHLTKTIGTTIACLIAVISFSQTNNSLNFDGSDDYVQTTFSGVAGSADRTFEAWIYLIDTPSGNNCITDYGPQTAGNRNTFIVNSNLAIGYISGGTNANITSSSYVVPVDTWTHVAFVLKSGFGYLYVNGSQVGTGNLSSVNTGTTGTKLRIGQRVPGGSILFNGNIDEVRIWDHARTANEIDSLKGEEICASASGLVAYYRFNEGTANSNNFGVSTALDNSSASNNGTLNNFGLTGSASNWVSGTSITSAPHSDSTISVTSCGSYTSPQGTYTINSGTITEVLTNHLGCDSIVNINVTIKSISFERDTITVCDSFVTNTGVVYKSSRIFNQYFTNAVGCDSIISTLLIVNKSKFDTITENSCGDYISPSGKYTWTTTGEYDDTLTTSNGCDSFIHVNLNIYSPSYGSLYDTACAFYNTIRGVKKYVSGTYIDTIPNANGCDSIISQYVIVNYPADTVIQVNACDSFTTQSGNYTWYTSGKFQEYLTNVSGCDSLIKYQLEIARSTSTSNSTFITSCDDVYVSPSGKQYTVEGTYNDTLPNRFGCDSAFVLEVVFHSDKAPSLLTQNKEILKAYNGFAKSYQWYDCDKQTNLSFGQEATLEWTEQPSSITQFGVEITNNYDNCIDSLYITPEPIVNSVNSINTTNVSVYPNPAGNSLIVKTEKGDFNQIKVYNIHGAVVLSEDYIGEAKLDISSFQAGLYRIELSSNTEVVFANFVKK